MITQTYFGKCWPLIALFKLYNTILGIESQNAEGAYKAGYLTVIACDAYLKFLINNYGG